MVTWILFGCLAGPSMAGCVWAVWHARRYPGWRPGNDVQQVPRPVAAIPAAPVRLAIEAPKE